MKRDDIERVFLTLFILVFLTIPFANADDGNETGRAAGAPYETEDDSVGIHSLVRENGTGQFNETPAPVPYIYVPPPVEPGKSLSATADTTATESYEYVRQWGTSGSGNGQFHSPAGLLVDNTGNVYVADHYGARVQKFSPDGTYISQFGTGTYGSGDGQMQNPWGVAEDLSHYIYVTDAGNNARVQKYNAGGTFITQWGTPGTGNGQFSFPTGVASDSSGKVYVAGYYNQRIQKFSSDGIYETAWGSYGTGDGQFNHLHGVAVDASDNVYIVDFDNNRIQKFSETGEYITKWGSFGTASGQFNGPIGIGLDAAGNVYVADTYNHRIQKFDSNGTYLTQWGTYGSGNGQFSRPHGVGVDSSGMVYVTDFDNHRVQVFQQLDPLAADFTGYPTNGTAPLTVYFNDTSTGSPISWNWSFGDGQFSPLQNTSHRYTSAGKYTVSLMATNAAGSNTMVKTEYVTVSRQGPAADFTASPTTGAAPLPVQFSDTSSSTGSHPSYSWDFGDGGTATAKNPSHLYASAGDYTVSLTVTDNKGRSDTEVKEGYVRVTSPVVCDVTGAYVEFVIENVSYPVCDSGTWRRAVCLDNTAIRWALAGESTPYYSTLLPWMWKRSLSCPDPGHSYAVDIPYNKPIYFAGVSNPDRVMGNGELFYHSVAAEFKGSGNVSDSSWQDWLFFQYDNLNISPGDWQIPSGTSKCHTKVWVSFLTSFSQCGSPSGPVFRTFYIDSNNNPVSTQLDSCPQGHGLNQIGLTHVNKQSIPDELKTALKQFNEYSHLGINDWNLNSTTKELTLFTYDIREDQVMENDRKTIIGNYSIRLVHDSEFETNRAEVQRKLLDLRKNPEYQIGGISMITDAFGDPPGNYAELWVYKTTPQNEKLEYADMQGWIIRVYPVSG